MSIQTTNHTCDATKEVTLVFLQAAKVAVTATPTENLTQSDFTFPGAPTRVLRFASGVLSVKNDSVTVRNRSARVSTNVTVSVPGSDMELRIWCSGRETVQKFTGVQRVRITDTAVAVTSKAAAAAPRVEADTSALQEEIHALRTKLTEQSRLMSELQQSTRSLLAENRELTAKSRELTAKNQELAAKNQELTVQNQTLSEAAAGALGQDIASRQGDIGQVQQRIADARAELEKLDRELEEKNRQLQEKTAEQDKRREELAAVEAKLQQVNDQMAALEGQQEITELDLEEATGRLEQIKARLQLDGDVIALTESRWLKNNSVSKTLEEMEKKIQAVEERIGFIIKARERFNQAVQAAVLVEDDGSISAAAETGNPPATQQGSGQTES